MQPQNRISFSFFAILGETQASAAGNRRPHLSGQI